MNEKEYIDINDTRFEAILSEAIPDKAPEEIINEVSPWRRAMKKILTGISLNALTLNVFCLQYILPAIGTVLCILGLRVLRRENKWFRSCYIITIINAVYKFAILILNATLIELPDIIFYVATPLLTFLQLVFLVAAIAGTQKKAGLTPKKASSAAIIIWYALLLFLGFMQYTGYILPYAMIIAFIIIVVNFNKISKEAQAAGYAAEAAPAKLSDGVLAGTITAIVFIGIACGYIFGGGYDMQWMALEKSTDSEVAKIKAELFDLGFPKYVLEDMTDEDILACKGAEKVIIEIDDHPVNNGRHVTEIKGNTSYGTIVYDVKELRTTGVAVIFGGEPTTMKIIHHFLWTTNPGFYGTESIQLWPCTHEEGWSLNGDITGRVLYTKDGVDYVSPFYSLGNETFTSNNLIFGEETSTDTFAAFSFPSKGENQRGYLTFSVIEQDENWLLDSWMNYTHQRLWLHYPAITAKEKRMSGGFSDAWFKTVQDALQIWDDQLGGSAETSEDTLKIYEELRAKGELK